MLDSEFNSFFLSCSLFLVFIFKSGKCRSIFFSTEKKKNVITWLHWITLNPTTNCLHSTRGMIFIVFMLNRVIPLLFMWWSILLLFPIASCILFICSQIYGKIENIFKYAFTIGWLFFLDVPSNFQISNTIIPQGTALNNVYVLSLNVIAELIPKSVCSFLLIKDCTSECPSFFIFC